MITTIHKGGFPALFLLILLVTPTQLPHVFDAFDMGYSDLISFGFLNLSIGIPLWLHASILLVCLIIQGIWFGRIMNRQQFFENHTAWPMVAYFVLAITASDQLLNLNLIIFNFVLLFIYHRLFNISEDELGEYQLYMDIGSVYAIGLIFLPEGIFMLPLILLAVNQFAIFDVNRFLLFFLSLLMIIVPVVAVVILYGNRLWIGGFLIEKLVHGISLQDLLNPELLYTYVAMFVAILVLIPTVIRELSFMQNQNRKIITIMVIHLVVGLMAVLLTSSDKGAVIYLISIPLVFLFSFGAGHLKHRWVTNVFLVLLLFALVFIQWVYVFNGIVV